MRLITLLLLLPCLANCGGTRDNTTIIYPASRVITMDAERSSAQAVAVRGDRILAVGDLEALQAQLADENPQVDERFRDKYILPGFIDPHIHPTIAATILPMHIVAAMAWPTVDGMSEPVRGAEAYRARLQELDRELPPGDWLMTWGYHAPYHGPMNRTILNRVSSERPIMIWQRSVHEMYFNSAALIELGLTEEDFAAESQANWQDGHLWEASLFSLGKPMMAKIAAPGRYLAGLSQMSELIHRAGITTVGEQGYPQTNAFLEYWSLRWVMRGKPYRFVLVPNAMFLSHSEDSVEQVVAAAHDLLGRDGDRIRVVKHVKYYVDGAIYSQLMQMSEPYLDGHRGEWMIPPEKQRDLLQAFWRDGWDIHIHVNGDAGLDKVLDDIAQMRDRSLWQQPKIVLEHYGYAREDQHQRVRELGVAVSNNPYYLFELAPIYARHGLGPERAENISPLGGLHRAGVETSFHSDFTMAPLQPLTLAWVAVNRVASDGKVWGAHQVIPRERALAAISIEAARSLGMEREIGSIEPGKMADFTILDRDPLAVPVAELRDIPVWGTVFEGKVFPLSQP